MGYQGSTVEKTQEANRGNAESNRQHMVTFRETDSH